ncbi:imelysin family protein [Pendulispora albinea]|uniref:Imelysin family protein n=1 Tax=Pendulispora albinea TaxID=2741071 RepID=A0ABZ2M5M8_9BACT
MKRRFSPTLALILGLSLAGAFGTTSWIAGCSSSSSGASSVDAKPVLQALTNDVILPTYRTLDTEAGTLRDAAEALRSAPSADSLARAQAAWRAARKTWRKADAFRFGPVDSKGIADVIDAWPANGEKLDQLLAGSEPITADSFEKLGANLKGFMALEHLLFDNPGGGDAAVLAKLTGTGAAERRRLYVAIAAANLKAKTAELLRSWDPAGENFAAQLTNAGSGSQTFPSGKSAVDQLVNSATYAGDVVAGNKIARPFGKRNGGVVQPGQEEAPRSDNSLADMLATLEGVQAVYDGAPGGAEPKGIGDLVRGKNASLDDRVLAALSDARAKVAAIPPPFRTALSEKPAPVDAAYESVRAMKNTFATEVASVLGTTLKFNDNDGD